MVIPVIALLIALLALVLFGVAGWLFAPPDRGWKLLCYGLALLTAAEIIVRLPIGR
jgi:hypothetical protein